MRSTHQFQIGFGIFVIFDNLAEGIRPVNFMFPRVRL